MIFNAAQRFITDQLLRSAVDAMNEMDEARRSYFKIRPKPTLSETLGRLAEDCKALGFAWQSLTEAHTPPSPGGKNLTSVLQDQAAIFGALEAFGVAPNVDDHLLRSETLRIQGECVKRAAQILAFLRHTEDPIREALRKPGLEPDVAKTLHDLSNLCSQKLPALLAPDLRARTMALVESGEIQTHIGGTDHGTNSGTDQSERGAKPLSL